MEFCSNFNDSSQKSSLFSIEEFSNKGGKLDAAIVLKAIQADIAISIPLCQALIVKYISNKNLFNEEELKALVQVLKLAIVATLEDSPVAAKSYTEAALLALGEIKKRPTSFGGNNIYSKAA